jgi:hypothetical protein
MQPCPGCPTLADHHGKLGSPSTKRARNPRRRERNDKSSGPLRRRGVVRRTSIGCQMTSGYRTCSCMLKCTGHQTILHGELSVDAGHVDRGSHKKASVLLLLKRSARAAQQNAEEVEDDGREEPALSAGHTPTPRHLINHPNSQPHSHTPPLELV